MRTASRDDLKIYMQQQLECMEQITQMEKQAHENLLKKNWMVLEDGLKELEELSMKVTVLEEERHKIFQTLRAEADLPSDAGFYEVMATTEEDGREEICELYRELRISVMGVSSHSEYLRSYAQSATSTITAVLDEVIPMRRGRIYEKTGATRQHHAESMVFNHSL